MPAAATARARAMPSPASEAADWIKTVATGSPATRARMAPMPIPSPQPRRVATQARPTVRSQLGAWFETCGLRALEAPPRQFAFASRGRSR